MKRFYDSEIEVMLGDVFDRHHYNAMREIEPLERIKGAYLEGSQQYLIVDNLINHYWTRIRTGQCGFLDSHNNCAFSVLYLVFRIDVIGFLFDVPWVPSFEIERFNQPQFVQRLSILEKATKALKEGDKLPIKLLEPEPNLWAADVQVPTMYSEELHGFFLRQAFKELNDFAEVGKDLKRVRLSAEVLSPESECEPLPEVFVHLVHSYSNHDADRLAYEEYRRRYGPHRISTLLH